MMFLDRQEGGQKLLPLLKQYEKNPQVIVLGLPRGGVVTAYEIAKGLGVPLDVTCPRKIGAPFNPELAVGAITETGEGILNQFLISQLSISQEYLNYAIEQQKKEAQHRIEIYRKNKPPLDLKEKIVILVDDGLATGATMKAAIQSAKAKGAKKIVVAVPVAPPDTLDEIGEMVDEVVCLQAPLYFSAVGQFYENFSQTSDEEVIHLLKEFQ